jgi:hypothetical protein
MAEVCHKLKRSSPDDNSSVSRRAGGLEFKINADVAAVHTRLKDFLTKLADDIGSGRNVEPTIDSLTVSQTPD